MKTEVMPNKNGQINIVLHEQLCKSAPKDNNEINHGCFKYIDQELASFVGLDHLKQTIKEIYAMKLVNEKREQMGILSQQQVLHMLFRGNPGTGKTTFARKIARLFFDMKLLTKGHFIEAERADLVGEYIGQTAQKTRAMIQRALGGVLFIDEAYALARGGEKDFGREAIDTLVTHMENNHDNLVIILAGYPEEMDYFLSLNPGLKSRFPFILDFNDFTINQLIKIAHQMLHEREYELTNKAEWKLRELLIHEIRGNPRHFANARYVRNVVEEAIRMHAVRILTEQKYSANDLMQITERDINLTR